MINGVDVSNWQGSYTWPSGLQFGFAKATEGTTFTDGQFARNWAQMKTHGVVRGAYHFGHPAHDPVVEAEHFLTVVRAHGLEDGDLLALDLETTDGRAVSAVAAWARTWCTHVQQRTGRKPLVYTYVSYARGGHCAGLGGYPLWIAAPSYAAGKPPMPLGPWRDWVVHQYSDSPVDRDVSKLTVAQLRALGGGPVTEEDDVPKKISVGTKNPVKLTKGKKTRVKFDVEYVDEGGMHANGHYPGILDRAADVIAEVTVTGAKGTAELVAHDMKSGEEKSLGAHPMGEPFTAMPDIYGHQHLYLDLTADEDASVHPYVKAKYWES